VYIDTTSPLLLFGDVSTVASRRRLWGSTRPWNRTLQSRRQLLQVRF